MEKTYKYQVSEIAFSQMEKSDQVQYKPVYQYREADPYIWNDCTLNIDIYDDNQKKRTWHYCVAENIEIRLVYRLKQF